MIRPGKNIDGIPRANKVGGVLKRGDGRRAGRARRGVGAGGGDVVRRQENATVKSFDRSAASLGLHKRARPFESRTPILIGGPAQQHEHNKARYA